MDDLDTPRMRAEILEELAPLFDGELASAEWGRALVTMIRRDDGLTFRVASIDVEDLFGDEARVDQALGGERMRRILPVIGQAVTALAATFDVDLADVEGGTFLRQPDGSMAFLPGLVHAPSRAFESQREGALRRLGDRQEALARASGAGARFSLDLEAGLVRFAAPDGRVVAEVSASLLGSFSFRTRTWVWAFANPSLPEVQKSASRAVCDRFPARDAWEISTPQFASDEATVRDLMAIVCDAEDAAGILRLPQDGGFVYLLLRDVVSFLPPG
jgi:hypothetical protein